jgi:hypothetical protein
MTSSSLSSSGKQIASSSSVKDKGKGKESATGKK